MSLNVKPSVHSHGDWSREVPCYALLFRLRSRPLVFTCPSTLPRAAVARHTGWGGAEGKKYIFSKFLPRCLFDRWTNFVEGFDNFFLFSSFFFSSGFFVGILIPCLREARILGIVSFAILSIRNLRKKELHEVDCNIKFFNWVFLGCKN